MRRKKDRHFVKSSFLINSSNFSPKLDRRPIGIQFFKRTLFSFLYIGTIAGFFVEFWK